MADNYAATAGSGLTFAAKNIGGILYPWWIPANSSGTELFTSGNAGYVQFPSAQAVNLGSMGGTSINAGCVGALSGYSSTIPSTVCGVFGSYVINTLPPGAAVAASSSPVVQPTDQISGKPISSFVKGTTAAMTGTTSTQLIAASSGKVIYVMNVDCVNSSATATLVTLQDGSGGTAIGTVGGAASGGGHAIHASFPETWTTSGNGLYVADVTTGANVICTASGIAQ